MTPHIPRECERVAADADAAAPQQRALRVLDPVPELLHVVQHDLVLELDALVDEEEERPDPELGARLPRHRAATLGTSTSSER